MTRAEFQSDEGRLARLAELLRDPILRLAIETVKNEGFPALPEPIPGVNFEAQVAAQGAYSTGWQRALRSLDTLPLRINLPTHTSIEAQFDIAARRRMRATGLYTESEIQGIPPPSK